MFLDAIGMFEGIYSITDLLREMRGPMFEHWPIEHRLCRWVCCFQKSASLKRPHLTLFRSGRLVDLAGMDPPVCPAQRMNRAMVKTGEDPRLAGHPRNPNAERDGHLLRLEPPHW